jgi:hypothetical protein
MKISFAITVCNELEEIKRLVPFFILITFSSISLAISSDKILVNSASALIV